MAAATLGDQYLRAEDLIRDGVWGELVLKISAAHPPGTFNIAAKKPADRKPIMKDVLEFDGSDKRLIIGPLNWRLLKYAIGIGNKSECVGHTITLYAAAGSWFGQTNVAALRVRIADGKYRPFIKPANLGKDITGQRFAPEPVPTAPKESAATKPPAKTAAGLVQDCESAPALEALLSKWESMGQVSKKADSWGKLLAEAEVKAASEKWSEDVDLRTRLDAISTALDAPGSPEY